MYIEICNDIIEAAKDPRNPDQQSAIELLQKAFLAIKNGKHFILIPSLRGIFEKPKELKDFITNDEWAIIKGNSSKYNQGAQVKNLIRTYMKVSYRQPDPEDGKTIIWLNPIQDLGFELHEESHIIVENLTDADVFEIITKKVIGRGNHILNYLSRLGGGKTTPTVVRQEYEKKEHLCLIIADSDKKTPNHQKGETAQLIIQEMRADWDKIHLYVMNEVREIENLIPMKYIESVNKRFYNIHKTHDLSYFDMKEGLKYKDLTDQLVCDHWNSIFCPVPLFDSSMKTDENKNLQITGYEGIGKSMMSNFITSHKAGENKTVTSMEIKNLSRAQYIEWYTIGQLFFDWTCAYPKQRL